MNEMEEWIKKGEGVMVKKSEYDEFEERFGNEVKKI